MDRKKYSLDRELFINRETDLHNSRIDRAQNRFLKILREAILSSLAADDNGILTRDNNFSQIPYRMDRLFEYFTKESIEPIVNKMQSTFEKVTDNNQAYFKTFGDHGQDENVKNSVFSTLGIAGGAIAAGSLLFTLLTDKEAINTIKSVVMAAISGGLTITALKIAVEEIVLRKDGGILKRLFEQKAPDPFAKIDRYVHNKYGVALKLNYAMYQGGTIRSSRPFCIERNNKVFSREEILRFGTPSDQFGGYDNKTTGDFQGKTDPYNPITDLGGYNCRHFLTFISDELAFTLRPDLAG